MVDSKWTRQWPELFAGLSDTQVRVVVAAINNNVLEGWEPDREDIALLTRAERGELTDDEAIAEAVALARRSRTVPAVH